MPKLIKKSKCSFENGHVIKKNKVIGIPTAVYLQLNKLEVMIQQWRYLSIQDSYRPGPSLEGWERKSALVADRPYVDIPNTPVTDKRMEEAIAFMAEADAVSTAHDINKMIDNFGELIDWCANDKFIEGDCINSIDLYELGNPLKLTPDNISLILATIAGNPALIEE